MLAAFSLQVKQVSRPHQLVGDDNFVTYPKIFAEGIAAAIGLIIDDAIVVVEVIYAKVAHGEPRLHAIQSGLGEIIHPLIGSTLTPVVGFIPWRSSTVCRGDADVGAARATSIAVGLYLLHNILYARFAFAADGWRIGLTNGACWGRVCLAAVMAGAVIVRPVSVWSWRWCSASAGSTWRSRKRWKTDTATEAKAAERTIATPRQGAYDFRRRSSRIGRCPEGTVGEGETSGRTWHRVRRRRPTGRNVADSRIRSWRGEGHRPARDHGRGGGRQAGRQTRRIFDWFKSTGKASRRSRRSGGPGTAGWLDDE